MFEQSRAPRTSGLAVVVVGLVGLGVAAAWVANDRAAPPPSPVVAAPEPAPTPAHGDGQAEVRAGLDAALAAIPGGRLYHLDCAATPCVATIRIPLPKGADASWRSRFEAALTGDGWILSPPGRVLVLDARQVQDGFLPERAFYVLAIAGQRPSEEAAAAARERITEGGGDVVYAFDPW